MASFLEKTLEERPSQHLGFIAWDEFFRCLPRLIRIHQWAKNSLVFLPLIVSHRFLELDLIVNALFAFFAFSLCASSTYILNDLKDVETDRTHPHKKKRPIAAGEVSRGAALAVAAILFAAGLGLAIQVGWPVTLMLLGYIAITSAYTAGVKKIWILDATVLSTLFTWRILSGAVATGIFVSPWLLLFSVFFFYSLALAKRATELITSEGDRDGVEKSGRGYYMSDLQIVAIQGVCSGFVAVMVFGLYINSPHAATLYAQVHFLWPICLILCYWISRTWGITMRGELCADPVVFALRDKASYAMGFAILILACLAKWIDFL